VECIQDQSHTNNGFICIAAQMLDSVNKQVFEIIGGQAPNPNYCRVRALPATMGQRPGLEKD